MRKKQEEHENHERWLVSYADFITLLFAFFVVMYAISSVNEGKYRVLSNSMVEAFDKKQVGMYTGDSIMEINSDNYETFTKSDESAMGYSVLDEKMRGIANDILKAMDSLVKADQVRVKINNRGVTVDINAGVLFETGEAKLGRQSAEILAAVAKKLKKVSNQIAIEGHTDDTPISTSIYPSNWELSSARASSVVRLFIESDVEPSRLTVVGYADQKPVETNLTEKGRARNRRVSVIVESGVSDNESYR
ncbi:MAG: flagellar motor protein MotD [Desulfobacteraceae bacterium]|jgi:chemotaxis protein MotB